MNEHWIVIALLAGILSNIANFFFRYLLGKGDDATLFSWFFELQRFLTFIIIAVFDFHLTISPMSIIVLVGMGLLEFVSIYIYMKMHEFTQLSISSIISRTRLIWIPLIAFLFMHERLQPSAYVGICILFLGLVIISFTKNLTIDKGQVYSYLSAFLVAAVSVLMKEGAGYASTSVVLLFLTFPSSFLFPVMLKGFPKRAGLFFRKNLWIKLLAGFANTFSVYLYEMALHSGPVSIVSALYHSTMVFAVVAGIILLKEKKDVLRKLIGTAVTVGGVILLSAE